MRKFKLVLEIEDHFDRYAVGAFFPVLEPLIEGLDLKLASLVISPHGCSCNNRGWCLDCLKKERSMEAKIEKQD